MHASGRTASGIFDRGPIGRPGQQVERSTSRGRRWRHLAVWTSSATILFICYLRVSATVPVNSDGASNALQAWDILHGNLLLHGWWLSDVSFYTTELPQYAFLELIFGLHSNVVHVAGAMTYTLVLLLAALLAKGKEQGVAEIAAVLTTVAIMIAPQLGPGAFILLLSPDHVGSAVPVLVAFLVIDRAPHRWYVPAVVGALLAWTLVADQVVLVTGVLPLLAVCSTRVYKAVVRQRHPWTSQWFLLSLGGAALASVAVAWVVQVILQAKGGYQITSLTSTSLPATSLHLSAKAALIHQSSAHQYLQRIPGLISADIQAVLLLFGADFLGQPTGTLTGIAVFHLAGLALAAIGLWIGSRRWLRTPDLVTAVLVAGVLINGAAYVLRTHSADVFGARDMAALLPFCAVLAGRLLGVRMRSSRWRAVSVIVLACYLGALGYAVSRPPVAAADQHLADWLRSRHLSSGLAAYWQADGTTLASDGRIQVSPVCAVGRTFSAEQWESNTIWYNRHSRRANFLIVGGKASCNSATAAEARLAFGRPAGSYQVGPYTILVWKQNLLASLR
jgi:hypothetical protein